MSPTLQTVVSIDLSKQLIGDVPYDKAFQLVGTVPDDHITSIKLSIKKGLKVVKDDQGFEEIAKAIPRGRSEFKQGDQFTLTFTKAALRDKKNCTLPDFLLPNREYVFQVEVTGNKIEKKPDSSITTTAGVVFEQYSFNWGFYPRSKIGDFTKLDFGFGYAPSPKALFAFTDVHIYFTPMNDETDLAEITSVSRNIFLRTSIFLGIAPAILYSDTKQPIKNEFGAGNFIFGLGFRAPFYWSFMLNHDTDNSHKVARQILQPMRLAFGEMLFKQADQNSIIAKDRNKLAPYIGISYDLSIASILGPIGNLFSK